MGLSFSFLLQKQEVILPFSLCPFFNIGLDRNKLRLFHFALNWGSSVETKLLMVSSAKHLALGLAGTFCSFPCWCSLMTVRWSMTKQVWKWKRHIVSSLCCVRGNRFNTDSTSCSYISSWLTYSRPRIGFNLRFHNLPWGLAFDYNEEYPGEAERRLSLVKSEMEEEGVDAAVEAR